MLKLSRCSQKFTHDYSQATKFENLNKMVARAQLGRESGKALTITPGPSRAQWVSRTSLTTLDIVQVQINSGLSNEKIQETLLQH